MNDFTQRDREPLLLRELLREGRSRLTEAKIPLPRLESEVLLADLLQMERIRLYAQDDREVDSRTATKFLDRIRLRCEGKPTAYITGHREFFGRSFHVNPSVLIPRPETEEIVELALRLDLPMGARVLDLGTGSGCIGLSLLCERGDIEMHLSDLSREALETARQNAHDLCEGSTSGNGVTGNKYRIHFHQSDLFRAIPDDLRFHAILSNPPYIHPDEFKDLSIEVRDNEPAQALFHTNPPELYRTILREGSARLVPDGSMILEISPRYDREILEAAGEYFKEARLVEDLSGKNRFVSGRRPQARSI